LRIEQIKKKNMIDQEEDPDSFLREKGLDDDDDE
jgi:hypothetical protein